MEKRLDDFNTYEQSYDVPVPCDHIDTDKIASSPYFQTYVSAWNRRFPAEDVLVSTEINQPDYGPVAPADPVAAFTTVPATKCARRLFPLIMVFIFSLLTIAVAVIGIFKIEAIAEYVALSGKYASVVELFECFNEGGATLQGVFAYILPVALYLSLAVVLIVFIMSIVGFCKCSKVCGFGWLTLVAFLLGVLAAVSLYLVLGAPEFSSFVDFGTADAIAYGFIGILGLELLAFLFGLFAYKNTK
ncbi:MAG: hypothetical protein PHI19_01405 [Clostridia bacterium]|nr:hypothetical protein [Clostridia bacterium]